MSVATIPAPAPVRTVTVLVRDNPVTVTCPDWCVYEHAERLAFLEDLSHHGAPMSLAVPVFGGGEERVLIAHLAQWPFSSEGPERHPHVALEAANDGECVELDASLAESVARGLEEHAARLRALGGLLASR